MMTCKGIVRGQTVQLEGNVRLPEGTQVEVVVKGPRAEEPALSGYPKGSAEAILAALDTAARCTSEDVAALLEAIQQGQRPVRFQALFDPGERSA